MNRDIVGTEEIDRDLLDGVLAQLEKDSYRSSRTDFDDMDAELHMTYTIERSTAEEKWTGQICVEVYDDYFQAKGDEVLVSDYFSSQRIEELEV